ncbi:hypothetical protein J6590_042703, partial [Homalodisca vitripennis]
ESPSPTFLLDLGKRSSEWANFNRRRRHLDRTKTTLNGAVPFVPCGRTGSPNTYLPAMQGK